MSKCYGCGKAMIKGSNDIDLCSDCSFDKPKTTPSLQEQIKARIAILTEIKTADRRHPNCEDCRVIIVEATARINELEQVLSMIDKTVKELKEKDDTAFWKFSDAKDKDNGYDVNYWLGYQACVDDALALLVKKE